MEDQINNYNQDISDTSAFKSNNEGSDLACMDR